MLTTSFSGSYGTFITCGDSTRRLFGPTTIVSPSGGACSMALTPMDPLAPGRFSTITGRPVSRAICPAITRAAMSVVPPGGAGTITFRGLSPSAHAPSASDHPINSMAGRANCCSLMGCLQSMACRPRVADAPSIQRTPQVTLAYLGHEIAFLGHPERAPLRERSAPQESHPHMNAFTGDAI